jgi:hypothetical protein
MEMAIYITANEDGYLHNSKWRWHNCKLPFSLKTKVQIKDSDNLQKYSADN